MYLVLANTKHIGIFNGFLCSGWRSGLVADHRFELGH